jgi:tripartite-type tricarboxylate transporter receptor subunit TctC
VLSDVPTFAESGYPALVLSNWQGVIVVKDANIQPE